MVPPCPVLRDLVVTMTLVTRTAYLRVYQPLTSFPTYEREQWMKLDPDADPSELAASWKWLLRADLPTLEPLPGPIEGAFIRKRNDEVLVCPWRTRLRMLTGLLAFRGTIPDEVAEAFVPEEEA